MRVFLSGTSLRPTYGGPATSVSRLADALARIGVDVGLWSPDGSALELPGTHPAIRRLGGSEAEALNAFGDPDVLHDNGMWLPHNHRLAQLARRRNLPRVVSTRGMLEPWARRHKSWKKTLAWHAYQRADLRRAALLHATSDSEAANLRPFRIGVDTVVIPNGVDIPETLVFRERSSGDRTALFIGRVYPIKGLPMLVEAWARVRPAGWRLRIAGPDEAGHLAEVRRAAAECGIADLVEFPGLVDGEAKARELANADLFILPTLSESFGIAVAEALAHGVPVLTTTAAPWPGLGERGCGWRVPPTADALAEALAGATSTPPDLLREMGLRGREWISADFRWERVADMFLSCYGSIAVSRTR